MSASGGSPFLNPKDMTVTCSPPPAPSPSSVSSALRSFAVEKADVSSTKSAFRRTGSSMTRSRFTASSMDAAPSPHRGWLRRVSL